MSVPFKAQIINHLYTEREHEQKSAIQAINPVDESKEFNELCEACRRGDIAAVRHLVQFKGVNVNAVDKFDYPPLTLASLCGHYDVVQLLLESGALCERDTFQGERCLYSALNDKIRNLLLQYDFSKSIDEKQPFASHISSLLTVSPLDTSDVTITATYHSTPLPNSSETPTFIKQFHLHRFLLCARSRYFRRKLLPSDENRKSPRHLRLPSSIDSSAFETTVKFLYLGEITETFSPEVTENIERISTHIDLPSLWEFVLVAHDRKERRLKRMDEVDKAQAELDAWCQEYVIAKAIRLYKEEAGTFRMDQNNITFADLILRADEDLEDSPPDAPKDWRPRAVFYPVHKAMLRSEFFTTMFTSPFREGQKLSPDEPLQVIPMDMTSKVMEMVLRFLYSDVVKVPLEYALDTLYAADELLIDRLKAKAAIIISTEGNAGLPGDQPRVDGAVEGYNVYDVIRAGWATRQRKLEEFGAKYIAERLEDYLDSEEFAELVQESADRIKARQETDTIELIDDIRYYLDQRFRMRMDDLDAEEMYDEEAGPPEQAPTDKTQDGQSNGTAQVEGLRYRSQIWTEEEIQADIMRAEAIKYDELLGKIDGLLEKLNLDA